jgi:hypothetical protein
LRRPELREACTQISSASGTLACNRKVRCEALTFNVVDPHHVNADPDSSSWFLFDADKDPDPGPTFHPDEEPDPNLKGTWQRGGFSGVVAEIGSA